MGVFLGLMPQAVLIAAVLFIAIYALSHYTSLASITCAATFPWIAYVLMERAERWFSLPFIAITSLLIILKHHQNIWRLLSGTEHRLDLKSR